MTTPPNDYTDLLHGQHDPALAHLVTDIDQALRAPAPPPALRIALQRELHQRTTVVPRPRRPKARSLSWRPTRRWAASLGAALLLAVSGVIGVIRLAPPTPVSAAQLVLRHAAAAFQAVPPDQASHAIYTMTPAPPSTGVYLFGTTAAMGTLDTWIQLDASGAVRQQATTIYSGTATMVNRIVQTGQTAMIYDARAGTVMTTTVPADDLSSYHLFNAAGLYSLVQVASQGDAQRARLLPRQTLDGHIVDVVEIDQPHYQEKETLYIDARTYILREVDVATVTAKGVTLDAFTIHLLRSDIAPLSSLPARTFALDAPATARAVPLFHSESVSVAQAVAQASAASNTDTPVLLLSGNPAGLGLRLQGVRKDTLTGTPAFAYNYETAGPLKKTFLVTTIYQSVQPSTATTPSSRPLTLTILGRTVHAEYDDHFGPSETQVHRWLTYPQGMTRVEIDGLGLSKQDFFAAVRALVDGRTHPDVITQLQQELGTTRASQ